MSRKNLYSHVVTRRIKRDNRLFRKYGVYYGKDK